MAKDELLVYGTDWCGDCLRARRFLDEHHVPYRWINIDRDREAEALARQLNGGTRSVPTLILPDGSKLAEPSEQELTQRLGLEG